MLGRHRPRPSLAALSAVPPLLLQSLCFLSPNHLEKKMKYMVDVPSGLYYTVQPLLWCLPWSSLWAPVCLCAQCSWGPCALSRAEAAQG